MSSDYTLTQKAIAEFLGTFSILFFGVGSVIIEFLTVPNAIESNTFILKGLGHGALGWTGIAIAHLFAVGIPMHAAIFLFWVTARTCNPSDVFCNSAQIEITTKTTKTMIAIRL